MIFGILGSQSCMLSEISSKLSENTTLKKIIERLLGNLKEFNQSEQLFENCLHTIRSQINKGTILIVDGGDITKNYTIKAEYIETVRDESTGKYKLGYHTIGATTLTPKKMSIQMYTRVFTAKENEFVSEIEETINVLKFLSSNFNKNNIRAFERGYDNNRYYESLIKHNEKFVIRAKKNRNVIYKGKRINIMKLVHKFKGKYSLKFRKKNSISADCKISIIPIKPVCRLNDELKLVVCNGFG